MTDDSLIDFLCGGEFDPEFEFKMKKMEIEEKDFRVRKDSFQDINSEFRNFSQFQNTQRIPRTPYVLKLYYLTNGVRTVKRCVKLL